MLDLPRSPDLIQFGVFSGQQTLLREQSIQNQGSAHEVLELTKPKHYFTNHLIYHGNGCADHRSCWGSYQNNEEFLTSTSLGICPHKLTYLPDENIA